MSALHVIEAFDIIDTSAFASPRGGNVLQAVRSVFGDEKKLSIAALSQTLSDRLIERMMP
jgi:hypothetical protein